MEKLCRSVRGTGPLRALRAAGPAPPWSHTFWQGARSSSLHLGASRRWIQNYSNFEKLMTFRPAIVEDSSYQVKKYEGFPEFNNEFERTKATLGKKNKKKIPPGVPGEHPDTTVQVGRKLYEVGKVNYKYVPPQSLFFEMKHTLLTRNKSPEQIRKLALAWMLENDRTVNKQFSQRSLGWNNVIVDTAGDQSGAQTQNKVKHYIRNENDVIAYSHYLMPARYNIAKRVLKELTRLLPDFKPNRILGEYVFQAACEMLMYCLIRKLIQITVVVQQHAFPLYWKLLIHRHFQHQNSPKYTKNLSD
jgi:hypothetical protein